MVVRSLNLDQLLLRRLHDLRYLKAPESESRGEAARETTQGAMGSLVEN